MKDKNEFSLIYYGASDVGLVRSENQDSFGKYPEDSTNIYQPKGLLFIVADGMGGHYGGKEASQTAVEVVGREYYSFESETPTGALLYAFKTANFRIHSSSENQPQFQKKGTTCSALVIENNNAHAAHVGDSRIYKIENDEIIQLTNDHTEVNEMLRKGILSEEEARIHPSKSVLVRAMGIESDIEVDLIDNIPLGNDVSFVLCSDGLSKVSIEKIKNMVISCSPDEACKKLIDLANESGGKDNVTVQVIKVKNQSESDTPVKKHSAKNTSLVWLLVLVFLAVFLGAAGIIYRNEIWNLFSNKPDSEILVKEPDFSAAQPDLIENIFADANRNFSNGNLDSALTLYNLVLSGNSFHAGALNGIEQIGVKYIEKGENALREKNTGEAVLNFRKALILNPSNRALKSKLLSLEKSTVPDISEEKLQPKNTAATITENVNSEELSSSSPMLSEWQAAGLSESDYKIKENSFTFFNTNKTKKLIFHQPAEDVDVEASLYFNDNSEHSKAGIIIGYNTSGESENYFVFTADVNSNFELHKLNGGKDDLLLSIKASKTADKNRYNLKLKSLGPWIMIYNNDKLLDSYLGSEFIKGKAGLYSESNTYADFTNFKISSAFEKK